MSGALASLREFLHLGADLLHDASVILSLALLAAGWVVFAWRLWAATRGAAPLSSLQAQRMLASLGALGGFVGYLRDISHPHAIMNLALGGASAAPWMLLVALEKARSFRRR